MRAEGKLDDSRSFSKEKKKKKDPTGLEHQNKSDVLTFSSNSEPRKQQGRTVQM